MFGCHPVEPKQTQLNRYRPIFTEETEPWVTLYLSPNRTQASSGAENLAQPTEPITYHALARAISSGTVDECKNLLAQPHCPIDSTENLGETLLMIAVDSEDIKKVDLLLAKSRDYSFLNAKSINYSALSLAAEKGSLDVVKALIAAGAEVNQEAGCFQYTPLLAAASRGHLEVVKALIDAKADIHYATRLHTVLSIAMVDGHHEVFGELLNAGADINAKTKIYDWPVLLAACHSASADSVQAIIDAKADINGVSKDGSTALLMAVANPKSAEVIDVLIKAGANIEGRNGKIRGGNTPLLNAAEEGKIAAVKALLAHGADIEAVNNKLQTPLVCACERGHVEIILALCEAGAQVNARSVDVPALSLAVRSGQLEAVRALLNRDASVNVHADDGMTPVMCAASLPNANIMRLLIEHGADINETNRERKTALLLACENHADNLVSELLKANADVNLADRQGNTPLMIAAAQGSVSTVRALLASGANAFTTNNAGTNAIALGNHRPAIRELLNFAQQQDVSTPAPGNRRR